VFGGYKTGHSEIPADPFRKIYGLVNF